MNNNDRGYGYNSNGQIFKDHEADFVEMNKIEQQNKNYGVKEKLSDYMNYFSGSYKPKTKNDDDYSMGM